MIPYGRQEIGDDDVEAVATVLRSEWLTQGPAVPRFERAVAGRCGAAHALAVNSATSALHLACLALGLGQGDLLWTTPITFVASANCARYCGAEVDFVDIDPCTCNMSVAALAEKLARAAVAGRLPKIVVPVHFAGRPCDMAAIHALGQRYGFRIVEDASHAIGASYRGEPVGNCRYSDITVFSFHPVKIITTGEGGMALTNDAALAETMALLRSHGITRDPARMDHEPDGPWYYQQIALGFNYRMTDIQAALGLSQLQRLDAFVARRRELAERYQQHLTDLPLTLPGETPEERSAWHLYVIRLRREQIRRTHREVFAALRAAGIGVNLHYIPVHTQPYYRQLGFRPGDFPEAERYYAEAISLPMYAALGDDQQDEVISAVAEAVSA
ncbi:MAG: UDP-4-amino-4,6-dideoxy-N-acetyl-beta-L-altrosamine transaminase [Rhodocyclaceae bacterium]|jgi:UDP-4-amino-4,6-dideoxy-N-acetyl-beta-L-altrosamine transaminase|nr:UDP-4-amino-4,6-dideoxy-N-acetyl-beta-L-altrosamine transaminase [Rhodocyclaceae bacterium]